MEQRQKKQLSANLGTAVSSKFSAALTDYRIDTKQPWHSHDDFVLVMVLRGNVREQVKSQDILAKEFDVGIKSPEVKHTDHFCPQGVRVIRLSIAPDFVTELKKQSLINEGWHWQTGSNAIRPFLRIGQSLSNQNSNISDDVHELLAALLPTKSLHQNTDAPLWLKLAKNQLDETFNEGMRLNQLAENAEVHPVYFARKFREFFGCSVGTYIRQLQFKEVHNLIASGKTNLSQIACEAGFSDQAHLTRTFNFEFGITPANFRKLLTQKF